MGGGQCQEFEKKLWAVAGQGGIQENRMGGGGGPLVSEAD